jgi:inosine-uridine nucleoside N-ribohydrolase
LSPLSLIIDTDPGIDDVVTLALAARSPEVDLLAVTTTYGNAPIAHATRNAREVLGLAGRPEVSVLAGSDRPLSRPLLTAPAMHGLTGVGYAPVPAAAPVTPVPLALLDALRAAPEPVTLLTLGPLTNLAHALERDPDVVRRQVRRHLCMLGAFTQRGSADRLADFNAWADPEAAHRVLQASLPTAMVPLDVTRRFTLSATDVERLGSSPDPLTAWLGQALRFYAEQQRARGAVGCAVHDVLTLGEVLSPGLLSFTTRRVMVDLDEGEPRGHTKERENGEPVAVATDIDCARMRALLERVFVE